MVTAATREALSSSYEELLRVAITGADRQGRGVGFAFFMRSGMACWIDACIDLLAQPAVVSPPQRRLEERCLGPDVRLEVAMVLTQMALSAHGQGVTTC